MCHGLDWCYPDRPNSPTDDIEDYIIAIQGTFKFWLDVHTNREAWAHFWICDDLESSYNKEISNDYFSFDWEYACYEIMAQDFDKLCVNCGDFEVDCYCDDPDYCKQTADDLADYEFNIGDDVKLDALVSKGFDTYREALEPVTSGIEEEVTDILESFDSADNNVKLLECAVWANHIWHVNGNILEDYGDYLGLDYDMVDSCSDGLDGHFGEDTVKEFLLS